ncbi:Ankyrin-1 [Dactylella cylindrospora]|nr:Ankyrin-1 [Dactylella cylindrospora]
MAIVRASLRFQRVNRTGNLAITGSQNQEQANLWEDDDSDESNGQSWTSYPKSIYGYELDLLALQLYGGEGMFISIAKDSKLEATSKSDPSDPPTLSNEVLGPLDARIRLAHIAPWGDLETRTFANYLQSTIEGVLEVISPSASSTGPGRYQLPFVATETTQGSPQRTDVFYITLTKSDNGIWKINRSELEALLGLWAFSITRMQKGRKPEYSRMISILGDKGITEAETWYKIWIQRRSTASLGNVLWDGLKYVRQRRYYADSSPSAPSHTVATVFGCSGLVRDRQYRTLDVPVSNATLLMCAQDLFMFFLEALLNAVDDIGGETTTRETLDSVNAFLLENTTVEAIADIFENNNLGSREDAYMCIFPVLQRTNKMPAIDSALPAAIKIAKSYQSQRKWTEAFRLLEWFNNNSSATEKEKSWSALGQICHDAIRDDDEATLDLAFDAVSRMVGSDPNSRTCKQYEWIALRVAHDRALDEHKGKLLAGGASRDRLNEPINMRTVDWSDKNNDTYMKYLMGTRGFHWNMRDLENRSPLHWAVVWRDHEIIDRLLKLDCFLDISDKKEKTPVAYAAELGFDEILEMFIGHDWSCLNDRDEAGKTMLIHAAANGHLSCTKLLVEQSPQLLNSRDKKGNTPIMHASANGHHPIVSFLLQQGAYVLNQNAEGQTVLHCAVEGGEPAIVAELLQHGINPNITDESGYTALHYAAKTDIRESMYGLLGHGANIHHLAANNVTALDTAAENGKQGAVITLIASGAHLSSLNDRDTANSNGSRPKRSAITAAARGGNLDTLKELVRFARGTSSIANELGLEDNDGRIPLHEAARNGHREAVEFLVGEIDQIDCVEPWSTLLNFRDRMRMAAVDLAAENGHTDVIRALAKGKKFKPFLDTKFDMGPKASRHGNPLFLAFSGGHKETLEFLIELAATTENGRYIYSNDGGNLVRLALNYSSEKMVKWLLENGAKFNWGDAEFLEVIRRPDRAWVVEMFLQNRDETDPVKLMDSPVLAQALQLAKLEGHSENLLAMLRHIARLRVEARNEVSRPEGIGEADEQDGVFEDILAEVAKLTSECDILWQKLVDQEIADETHVMPPSQDISPILHAQESAGGQPDLN